jgi:hypothetical protein
MLGVPASSTIHLNGIGECDAERSLAAVWRILEEHALPTPLLDVRSANASLDITLTFQSPKDCAAVEAELVPSDMQMRAIADAVNEQEKRIKRWRQKAEELRTIADQFTNPSTQQTMQRVAADYEKLADDGEARISGQPPASSEKAG